MQGRVILSHGRSLQALAAAQSLAQRGIEIIGCDNMPLTVLAFSKYVQKTFVLPSPTQVTEDEYIEALVEQVKAHRPADGVPYVLMPVDWETRLFAKHHQRLAPYITLAAPLWDTLQRVDPKNHLVQTAREYDLRIPPTLLPADADELDAKADSLHYPLFIKVPDGSGGNGIRHCHDATELRAAYDGLAQQFQFSPTYQPLIQEAVGNSDCCVTLLAQHGEIKAHATYRNLRAFPLEAGPGHGGKPLPTMARCWTSPVAWREH